MFGDLPPQVQQEPEASNQDGGGWPAAPVVAPVTPPPAPFFFGGLFDLSFLVESPQASTDGSSPHFSPTSEIDAPVAPRPGSVAGWRPAAPASPVPGNAASAERSKLAFELRWAGEDPAVELPLENTPKPKQESLAPPVAPVVKVAPATAREEQATPLVKSVSTAVLQTYTEPRGADPAPSTGTSQPANKVHEARFEVDTVEAPAAVREIAWNMKGPDNRTAYVRLAERSGEVVVTVRTPHQELVQPLRSGLPELVDRLRSDGIPVDAARASSASLDSGGSSRQSKEHGTDLSSGRGWQENSDLSDRQRHHPSWKKAFETQEEE
jgi:hypothetical protein